MVGLLPDKYKIKTPAQIQLVGPSQCGKSTKIKALVADADDVFDTVFHHVVYAAPILLSEEIAETDYVAELREICKEKGKQFTHYTKLPHLSEIRDLAPKGKLLYMCDDITSFHNVNNEMLVRLSLLDSHHCGITFVHCVQNPFQKSALDLQTLSRNLTGRFLFWQVADLTIYQEINRKVYPGNPGFILRCLTEAKSRLKLNYVFLNLHPRAELSRKYICYTGLFSGELGKEDQGPYVFPLEHLE